MIMCIQNLVLFCQFVLKILSKNQILTSNWGRNSVANLRKTKIYNTNVDLVNHIYICLQNLVFIGLFVFKILSKNQILTSIKGRNYVEICEKTMVYNTNVELVNHNVCTKFGLYRSIRFQDIKQKLNSEVNQGPLLCCKFAEIRTHPRFHSCPRYLQE